MKFSELLHSSGWKNFMAKMYGIGASVVILGALFKIQHWPGAGIMLTLGLGAEALIFFLSAFEPMREDVDWSLVYPELAGIDADEEGIEPAPRRRAIPADGYGAAGGGGNPAALAKFDEMIQNAEITPELFERLGQGLKNLKITASKLSEISDATVATNEYVSNIKNAAISVNNLTSSLQGSSDNLKGKVEVLSESYQNNSELINRSTNQLVESYELLRESINTEHKTIIDGNKNIGEKLGSLNKNLSALNTAYEMQLQDNQTHLKSSQELYSDFSKITNSLKTSVEETENYRNEIGKLSKNLAELNSIYGNMLSAMSSANKSS